MVKLVLVLWFGCSGGRGGGALILSSMMQHANTDANTVGE